jgi:hypothetical protein
MLECMVVAMLGAGIGSNDLGKTLVDEHIETFMCCLIVYDEWCVVQ